jgi:hypothetical protein
MENIEYYEIRIPKGSKELDNALSICIGKSETQRYSLDGTSVIIKTTGKRIFNKQKQGVKENIIFPIKHTTELTRKQALKLANSEKYQAKNYLI